MKKLYSFLFLFLTTIVFSQEDAWVYFKSKTDSQTYFDSPLKMLSQRAIDRRTNQNIALDSKDIPIDYNYIKQVKASNGITVMAKSKWLNALHVRGTQTAILNLKSLDFVQKVVFANTSLNTSDKVISSSKSNITSKSVALSNSAKIAVTYNYGNSGNQIGMLNGNLLHQQNYTGSGKIIAILDGGFPGVNTVAPFQRLRDNNQILGGYDYVNRSDNFYTSSSHGTSVLSTMGGYVENELIGTAPDASYYLFITEDSNNENPVEESLWVEAAERADSLGVDIINTSLGYFDFDNSAYNHTYNDMNGKTNFITLGADIAFSRGMMVVVSAGNSGSTSNPNIAAPADGVSVLTIGSVTGSRTRTGSSSIGPSFDNRVKPDVMAQGAPAVVSNEYGTVTTANGTSFSSPIIAGMVACLWQALPDKTNEEIRQLIIASSDRFANPDVLYGYGIPDFNLALTNDLQVTTIDKNSLYIYPNPVSDYIKITIPTQINEGKMFFYTTLGQKVFERKINNQSDLISLKALNSGVYFYTFESDTFIKSGKIIKQ